MLPAEPGAGCQHVSTRYIVHGLVAVMATAALGQVKPGLYMSDGNANV